MNHARNVSDSFQLNTTRCPLGHIAYGGRLFSITYLLLSQLALCVWGQAPTRTDWIAKFDSLDSALNGGMGFASSTDSGTLAWGESYLLRAYLNMYEATYNTDYLDVFVAHADEIIGHMDDPDGDGYSGWDSSGYSVNLVQNGGAEQVDEANLPPVTRVLSDGFESASLADPSLPEGWARWQSTASTAYLDSEFQYSGQYGLSIETNPSGGWQIAERTISYEAGAAYRLSFMAMVSGNGAEGCAVVFDSVSGTVLGRHYFHANAWHEESLYYKAPDASGHNLKVRLYHADYQISNVSVHVDDLAIDRLDGQVLPAGWTRWQSTPSTAYGDFENAVGGIAGFALESDPSAGWQVLEQDLDNVWVSHSYEPGLVYEVSFDAMTNGGLAGGRLSIYDVTAGQSLFSQSFSQTAWQSMGGSFVAPSEAGHLLRVRLTHSSWDEAGVAFFDNIRIAQRAEYAIHDGMLAVPLSRFVCMVHQAVAPAGYAQVADDYYDVIDQHLVPKWQGALRVVDVARSVLVQPEDGSLDWPGNTLPHNQYLALAEACTYLSTCTSGQTSLDYRNVAEALTAAFKSQLRLSSAGTAYEWDYYNPMLPSDYILLPGVEDISHGNIDVAAMVSAFRAGITFDSQDMERLANTLLEGMWNGSLSAPTLGYLVNSSAYDDSQYAIYAWIRLGEFDRQVYDVIRGMYDNIWNDAGLMNWRRLAVISQIVKGALAVKEDFEAPSPGDSTLPDGWVRWQSASSTAYLDSANAHSGAHGLTVETDPVAGWQVIYKEVPYTPGARYRLTFMGRAKGANVGGRVTVSDHGVAVLAAQSFSGLNWQPFALEFSAPPVSGHTLRIRLLTSDWSVADGAAHYDNIELREIN